MYNHYVRNSVETILKSRRLLSDHLQIIEQCTNDIKDDTSKITNRKHKIIGSSLILGLGATTIVGARLIYSKKSIVAVAIAAASLSCYVWDMIKRIKLNRKWQQIDQLLTNISLFDVCIRRNISYFKDTEQLRLQLDDKSNRNKNALAQSILHSIVAITCELYESTTFFEYYPLPLEYDDLYQNVDNLEDCELFQKPTSDFDESHIKEFYNVFLYIQSQFLTRFALAIVYNTPEVDKYLTKDIGELIICIAEDLRNDEQHLLSSTKAIQRNNEQLHRNNIRDHISSEPIRQLKENSLELSSKTLALATYCTDFDGIIQSINANDENHYKTVPNDMKNLQKSIEEIENTISLCKDTAKHLGLMFEKFLAYRYNVMPVKTIEQQPLDQPKFDEISQKIDETTVAENQDYFANIDLAKLNDDNEQELKVNSYSLDDELNQINSKLVRRQFKPVLKQLKNKISPISAVMHKRELDYLQAKGLPTDSVINDNKLLPADSGSDSNESDDEPGEPIKVKKDVYSERREFLQSKAQMFVIPPPPSMLSNFMKTETFGSDEEIIE